MLIFNKPKPVWYISTFRNGVKNIFAGVPVIIGKEGVEKIEEISLDEKEKSQFIHSIEAVKKLWDAASVIDKDLSK